MTTVSMFEQNLRETFPNLEEELSKKEIDRSFKLAAEIQIFCQRLRSIFPDVDAEIFGQRLQDIFSAVATESCGQQLRKVFSDVDTELPEDKLDRMFEVANEIRSEVGNDTDLMATLCNAKMGAASASESEEAGKASPDSEGLGFAHHGGITVGYVDEVHGPGATLCPDYVSTREELRILARHWSALALEFDTFYFATGQVGSCDTRTQAFAERRVVRIAGVLGRDSVEEVVGEVRDECRRRMGDRKWNIFENGTAEERERILEETHAASREGPSAPGYVIDYLKEEAVKVFPELPARELAAALRFAANAVGDCLVEVEPCDHEWQTDPDEYVWTFREFASVLQRCAKCRAIRKCDIYPDDPDFKAAIELARQQSTAELQQPDEDTNASTPRALQEPQD
ncbi:MAG: hypothetical protein HQ567_24445 [Candidatus Nealsonbacteria bacterium]|nr:hypothetical protein [Candidatus Nealsonbacteria bacterium]